MQQKREVKHIYGAFLKWWYTTNPWVFHGFPIQGDQHLGCEMGVFPPFEETPTYENQTNPFLNW